MFVISFTTSLTPISLISSYQQPSVSLHSSFISRLTRLERRYDAAFSFDKNGLFISAIKSRYACYQVNHNFRIKRLNTHAFAQCTIVHHFCIVLSMGYLHHNSGAELGYI